MYLRDGIQSVYLKARTEGANTESAWIRAIAYYLHEAPWANIEEAAEEVNAMVLDLRDHPSWWSPLRGHRWVPSAASDL